MRSSEKTPGKAGDVLIAYEKHVLANRLAIHRNTVLNLIGSSLSRLGMVYGECKLENKLNAMLSYIGLAEIN